MSLCKVIISYIFVICLFCSTAEAAVMGTEAKYAIIMDYDTGTVLLSKEADKSVPPASMSKLMTIYILMEKLKHGVLSPDDEFTVSENAWKKGGIKTGSSTMFLKVGEKVKVGDLLKGIIIQSGNDACIVVAENISGSESKFAEEMNRKAEELGLKNSHFKNSTGWPATGHNMSTSDIGLLSLRIIKDFPEYYSLFAEKSFTHNGIKQGNRNPLLYSMQGVADGLKTGHTEASGFGLAASGKDESGRRIILVLNGLKSMKSRREESTRLMNWAMREFENTLLFSKDSIVSEIPVFMGESKTVKAVPKEDIIITNSKTGKKSIKVTLSYNKPLFAPISKGTEIGKIIVSSPDFSDKEFILISQEDVSELGLLGKLMERIKYLLGIGIDDK